MDPARAGARNLITDVPGISVGQAHDARVRSGVTVILPDRPAVCAVEARGGAPGSRETEALGPHNLVETVDAVVLTGGSVYGLGTADGVAAWLGARERGYRSAAAARTTPVAPLVPAAVLFDLSNGGDKAWGLEPPYRALGLAAVASAGAEFELGTAGAGYGATAGALKGGVGSASAVTPDGLVVGAIVAVNSFGAVVEPGSRAFWAAPFEVDGEFGGAPRPTGRVAPGDWGPSKARPARGQNTTIACVATNVALTPAQAQRLAIMANDGLARAVRPAHAPFDGDVVFALATAERTIETDIDQALTVLGSLAGDCLARAIARGVYEARPWPGTAIPCWRDLPPDRE